MTQPPDHPLQHLIDADRQIRDGVPIEPLPDEAVAKIDNITRLKLAVGLVGTYETTDIMQCTNAFAHAVLETITSELDEFRFGLDCLRRYCNTKQEGP